MSLIEFKNLPDTSTPLNAENLNNNFNELSNQTLDLTNIKTIEYTKQITTAANGFVYNEVSTSTPTGYALIGYIIGGNGYVAQVISSIISSSNSSCVFNCFSTQSTNATIKIIGIYAKRVNQ